MIIAVDFDGTLVGSAWPAIGEPVPTAIETMQTWRDEGHKLIVWTCRAGRELDACKEWLIAKGVPFDAINENLPERIALYGGSDTRKVSADVYVDDRAVGVPSNPVEFWTLARERISRGDIL